MKITSIAAFAAGLICLSACSLKNDIDYPVVEGYFTDFQVEGQLSSSISRTNATVTLSMSDETDLSSLKIVSIGLSDGASCDELSVGSIIDLTSPLSVVITTYQQYEWTISATLVSVEEEYISVNAWAYSATFTSEAEDDSASAIFEWKSSDDSDWNSGESVSATDGVYTYSVSGLSAATTYSVRLNVGGSTGDEVSFTTEEAAQLPNMSFDEWCTEEYYGKTCWYPAPEVSEGRIWDSANKGVLTIQSTCATTPESEFVAVSGSGKQAARLESMYPNVLGIGRFAAGSLLTGEFLGATGSGGGLGAQLNWGVEFTTRPSALHGYYAYAPGIIDHDDEDAWPDLVGQGDQLQIFVLLTDWSDPFTVDTSAGVFVDFDNDSNIIAVGLLETGESTYDEDGNLQYVEFTLPLEYRDLTRKPKYVVVSSCSSRYGDTFTGAVGSLLYVDEFEFIYE